MTTPNDFEIFVLECKNWINFLGLFGWQIYYYHEELEEDSCATCSVSLSARVCSIRLNTKWEDYTEKELKQVAFHEVCELFFARIEVLATDRGYTDDDIREEIHNLIRIMEKTFYANIQAKRV